MVLFSEHADVSVRPATAEDAAAITRVQLRAWRAGHAERLGAEALEHVDVAAVRDTWASAVTAPPSPAHRVLVACDGPRIVGLAASAPTGEGGVEVLALEVDPDHQRVGHGSRLLTACVDLARADGATSLQTWVLAGDEGRERFLAESGLGPDGARRELEVEPSRSVPEHRWSAVL